MGIYSPDITVRLRVDEICYSDNLLSTGTPPRKPEASHHRKVPPPPFFFSLPSILLTTTNGFGCKRCPHARRIS